MYPAFLGFLLSVTLLAIVVMTGFVLLMRRGTGEDSSMSTTMLVMLSILVGLPTLLLGVALVSFCGWHLYLICSGKTTRERLKGLSGGGGPATGGCPCGWMNSLHSRGESLLGLTQRISRARAESATQQAPPPHASPAVATTV